MAGSAHPTRLSWASLLSDRRLAKTDAGPVGQEPERLDWLFVNRIDAERDGDRVLFATPTRRLGDKTQVFPLEKNESVRNRLTHSHEVAALARSMGTHLVHASLGDRIVHEVAEELGEGHEAHVRRAIPAILATIGLAHDLGNPPFGHQGENAIRSWITTNAPTIFGISEAQRAQLGQAGCAAVQADLDRLTEDHKNDFRWFEGNAQTLRTLTRLQVVRDGRGLNLTFGTLAALMKYTVGARGVRGKKGPVAAERKLGFYSSERPIVAEIHAATGLREGLRHPLTYLMEACDDIAYSVIDAEDAIKKQIVSFHDLTAWLKNHKDYASDPGSKWVVAQAEFDALGARANGLSPDELNDVSMQLFRSHAIHMMVSAVLGAFEENYDVIMAGALNQPLIEVSKANTLCELLKSFDYEHAYRHRRVLEIELAGFNTIHGLMDMLWRGITERESFEKLGSERTSPFARYAYGRISENYRRVFERRLPAVVREETLPIRYRELQLLTDMVAGMTDQFAVDLHRELKEFHVGASERR